MLDEHSDSNLQQNNTPRRTRRGSGRRSSRPLLMAAQKVAERWDCAVSTVHRIAHRQGFRRVCLGHGRNGMVRYLTAEIEAYEAARQTQRAR